MKQLAFVTLLMLAACGPNEQVMFEWNRYAAAHDSAMKAMDNMMQTSFMLRTYRERIKNDFSREEENTRIYELLVSMHHESDSMFSHMDKFNDTIAYYAAPDSAMAYFQKGAADMRAMKKRMTDLNELAKAEINPRKK